MSTLTWNRRTCEAKPKEKQNSADQNDIKLDLICIIMICWVFIRDHGECTYGKYAPIRIAFDQQNFHSLKSEDSCEREGSIININDQSLMLRLPPPPCFNTRFNNFIVGFFSNKKSISLYEHSVKLKRKFANGIPIQIDFEHVFRKIKYHVQSRSSMRKYYFGF